MKYPAKVWQSSPGRRGAVLEVVLVLLVAVALLGAGLLTLSSADAREAAKAVSKRHAFWTAEAGLEDVKALAWRIRNTVNPPELFPASGTRSWSGATGLGTYNVTITQPILTPPGYLVESRGVSLGGRTAGVAANLLQVEALGVGVFGDDRLRIQPNVSIYSYDSSAVTGTPNPTDSTGQASVGSNEEVDLSPGLNLDGEIILGVDDTDQTAACDGCGGFPVSEGGPIDPDPLGIIGGPLELELNAARLSNDNASVPEISGNVLTVPNATTVVMDPGTYYTTGIDIRGDLDVEGTNGVVTIFLEGAMNAWPGSVLNNGGAPSSLRIYSNSTEPVILQPHGSLSALVYAPYSTDVDIKPSDSFYGVVWGQNVQLFPGSDIYVDTHLLEFSAFNIYRVELANWREFSGY